MIKSAALALRAPTERSVRSRSDALLYGDLLSGLPEAKIARISLGRLDALHGRPGLVGPGHSSSGLDLECLGPHL